MTRLENRLLTTLRQGGSAAAVWLTLGSPVLAEFAAEAGAEAVVLDAQHGLWQRKDIEAAIGHIRPHSAPLVRVAENRPHAIGEMLDAGAMGVIVPVVETAEEARAAVFACRYPPQGIRSGGGIRPLGDFVSYVAAANREILVSVMIETAKAIENLDAILAVPGIDLIFIGPGDLALSLGEFPNPGPGLESAIQAIRTACGKARIPCGIFTSGPDQARARLDQGFQFVTATDDLTLTRGGIATALAKVHSKS